MLQDDRTTRPRRVQQPIAPALAVGLWIAGPGNLALWIALARLGALSGPSGWLFGLGFGAAIAASIVLLGSLLAWRATFKPLLVLLLVAAAVGAHFMLAYGVVIDPTMMVNVMQTNPGEAGDLLGARMFATVALLGLAPAAAVLWWPVRYARSGRQLLRNLGAAATAAAVLVGAVLAVFQPMAASMRNHKQLRYLINPLNSLYALGVVAAEPLRPAARTFRTLGEDAHLRAPASGGGRPPLLVLVVGETARADHFALNGYARATNPELAALDVLSLRQARSCGTSTAASLPCMFSHLGRAGYEGRDANYENLLDVLHRAGLGVLWLDNQAGCKGVCERVAQARPDPAAHQALCTDGECLDEVLLEGLDARIAALPAERRARGVVLVLHPMGSHGPAYHRRSPPTRKPFQPECTQVALQDCAPGTLVNAYDNSIAYTDHVLARTIDWLRQRESAWGTGLLYVSDHGESLGEGNLYLHGLPYAVAPDVQTRVPWIQWLSPAFAARAGIDVACLRGRLDVPVSHDHLFHTVLGLMGVQTSVLKRELDANAPCTTPPSA